MDVELLVEGYTDEIFVRSCFEQLGISVGTVYGKRGVGYVIQNAAGFSVRGQFSPILILADLADMKGMCVVEARDALRPVPYSLTLARLAVREIESWAIASRQELAAYLGISIVRIPNEPDTLADPKQALVNLARESPRTRLRDMIVPKEGASSAVGRGYVDAFSEFMREHWRVTSAQEYSPSFAQFSLRCEQVFAT